MTRSEVPENPGQPPARSPAGHRKALLAGLAVFLLALGVRLAFLSEVFDSYLADDRVMISDSRFYHERAEEIAAGDLLGREPGYLSPVYCGFLGLVYAAGGDFQTAKVAQAFLGALTCLFVFLLGRRLFEWKTGALAGTVFALYGMHVFYTGLLLPTVLEVLFNVWFLLLLVPGERPSSLGRTFAAGALLGVAIGSKPNALLMVPVAMLWILIGLRELDLGRRIRLLGCLFFGVVATLAPVTLRNYLVSEQLVLVSVVGGRNLYKGNGPYADGSHVFLPPGRQGISLMQIRTEDVDPALAVSDDRDKKRETFEHMRENPGRALTLFARKLYLMFNAHELGIRDDFGYSRSRFAVLGWLPFTFVLVVPIGLVGMVYTLRRRRFALIHLLIAAQVVSFVLVFVLGRYRLVMVACLAVLAAGHVMRLIEAVARRDRRTLAWSAALLAAFTVPALLPTPWFPKERGWADQHALSAEFYKSLGRWDEALVDWAGALETTWANENRRTSNTELYAEIARCHHYLGRPEDARRALRQAEAIFDDPDNRATKGRALEQIEQVRELLGEP